MAIARGAGTEIIRSVHFEDVDSTDKHFIIGEQHHIYTVLSIIVTPTALNAITDTITFSLRGYDSNAGTTAQAIRLFQTNPQVNETFVFNDKFSFNGFEPVDFAAGIDATKQDAIADQGSAVSQYLHFSTDGTSTYYDVTVTYIDQNNA